MSGSSAFNPSAARLRYRFKVQAQTQPGEFIEILGSAPELGGWDITRAVKLRTQAAPSELGGVCYPSWWVDVELEPGSEPIDYKYVYCDAAGYRTWEGWGSNRWVPRSPGTPDLIVEDGWYGQIQPWPYAYWQTPPTPELGPLGPGGMKIVVYGSSVAMGASAWLLDGWASQVGAVLNQRYGHQLVNRSVLGANVGSAIAQFPQLVTPECPDIVIIALSLGNEGLATSSPHQFRAIQRRFESGLQHLLQLTRQIGAYPILGGLYPHNHYTPEQTAILRDTQRRMLTWGVPVLNWLDGLDDGQGHWRDGLWFDPAHPNSAGHRRMAEQALGQIDQADLQDVHSLNWLSFSRDRFTLVRQQQATSRIAFQDAAGFSLSLNSQDQSLQIHNPTAHPYRIVSYWDELHQALDQAPLQPGLYLTPGPITAPCPPSLAVNAQGRIETLVDIPPATRLVYQAITQRFGPTAPPALFYDGQIGILREDEHTLVVLNESDHEYNIHPMWREVRSALKAMPSGVYHDPQAPDAPFRTLMIGPQGLESRVRVAARSALRLHYRCALSEVSRVGIIPLGDRCAVRMLLYKLGYDGPAFPFDLTRTTNLGDVADIINSGFSDMWNPSLLHYNADEKRIYHGKWSGLSFAHEVEDDEDPIYNMYPIHERMRTRYSARAQRFWYTLNHADKLLFARTGGTHRGYVENLLHSLENHCQGKPFQVLILSPQDSAEFAGLANVTHVDVMFNPDHMYADDDHWNHCSRLMLEILNSLGISSQNLFWCPPNPAPT